MKIHKFAAAVMLSAAVLLLALSTCSGAFALKAADLPEPGKNFYVLDSADVIDSDTESYIVSMNETLYDETGAQIVVVAVDFVENGDLEQYAYNLFNKWGIGSKDKDNGVLLLLSIGDDNYWGMQGPGLEKTLTSGTIGDIMAEYLEPDFAAQDYDAGVRKTFDALYSKVASIYNMSVTTSSSSAGGGSPHTVTVENPQNNNYNNYTNFVGGFFDSPVMIIIIIIIILFAVRGFAGRYAGGSSDGCLGCLLGWLLLGDKNHRGGPPRGGFGGGSFGGGHHGGFGGGGFGGGGGHSGGFGSGGHSGGGGSTRGGGAGRR